jgi:hypothetical protein
MQRSVALCLLTLGAFLNACGSDTVKPNVSLSAGSHTYSPSATGDYAVAWNAGSSCGDYDIDVFLVQGAFAGVIDQVSHGSGPSGSTDADHSIQLRAGDQYAFSIRKHAYYPSGASGPIAFNPTAECPGWSLQLTQLSTFSTPPV